MSRWLFSPTVDVAAFGGSAALSLFALAVGWQFGWLDGEKADTPDWTWIAGVLLIDVAHGVQYMVCRIAHSLERNLAATRGGEG